MRNPITIKLNNISFQLKELQNFDWLTRLGTVFCVFDQQDSGNISFGIQNGTTKRFVKFAGASTLEYSGDPQEAIERLKQAIPVYEALNHPRIIKLVDHFEAAGGYALVFEWFEGECLHPHWSFPPPAKYNDPNSPFYRYRQLPVEQRLLSLNSIFSFHVDVEARGYVAVDFYDGSILYDFNSHTTMICDIDYYQQKPFINTMGRLWGSSRFMSPEEFELGASIDGVTNIFNMGAIAFGLIGGELDHAYSKWEAGKALYDVALKATEPKRNERYTSMADFYKYWMEAQNGG
ncbi:serine/threonine protein kinase [Paenibacillus psychroresistens]|uniref:Serine/threonine protein kinase n=1 Tax=Paenibacillus psychroresistens TaxID=1778678 RepID=A0A6B8RC91_9BACL|nr:serine/threonine protein kinase [Paenibacillus psychroresistens]QGQ93820.1 serine/threonine protein kinase [Paenibacillus psychroresistens]